MFDYMFEFWRQAEPIFAVRIIGQQDEFCHKHSNISIQGPLITVGRNSNEHFANGPSVGYPWHFKSNKGIITKFK